MHRMNRSVLAAMVGIALLPGCKKQDDGAAETAAAAEAAVAQDSADADAVADEASPDAPVVAPVAVAFDIGKIPVSEAPLGEWPHLALPTGYVLGHADDLSSRTKDLARVPVWTGGQLLWVEGKVFSDRVSAADGKTWSKFELRKHLQQAIEAMGGVRLTERNFDGAVQEANNAALDDFRGEFGDMHDAYWHDNEADTYVIRRADKAVWIVMQADNSDGGVMVVEGPLPAPPPAQ